MPRSPQGPLAGPSPQAPLPAPVKGTRDPQRREALGPVQPGTGTAVGGGTTPARPALTSAGAGRAGPGSLPAAPEPSPPAPAATQRRGQHPTPCEQEEGEELPTTHCGDSGRGDEATSPQLLREGSPHIGTAGVPPGARVEETTLPEATGTPPSRPGRRHPPLGEADPCQQIPGGLRGHLPAAGGQKSADPPH